MDTQSKLLRNRKDALLKQYKLNAAKDRLKKNVPNFSSIIYCNNDGKVLITKKDETCGTVSDVKFANGANNLTSTNIKSNGKRLSPLQINKMYSTYRCSWSYGEKSYVSKPGCIEEVKSSENGKTSVSLSDVEGFPGRDQLLNDFYFNLHEDYSTYSLGQTVVWENISQNSILYITNLNEIKYVNEIIKNKTSYKVNDKFSVEIYTINISPFYYIFSSFFINDKNINNPLLSRDYTNNKKEMSFYNYKRMKPQSFNNTKSLNNSKMYIVKTDDNKWPYNSIRNSYSNYTLYENEFFGVKLIDFLNKNFKKSVYDYQRFTYYEIGKKNSLKKINYKPSFNDGGGELLIDSNIKSNIFKNFNTLMLRNIRKVWIEGTSDLSFLYRPLDITYYGTRGLIESRDMIYEDLSSYNDYETYKNRFNNNELGICYHFDSSRIAGVPLSPDLSDYDKLRLADILDINNYSGKWKYENYTLYDFLNDRFFNNTPTTLESDYKSFGHGVMYRFCLYDKAYSLLYLLFGTNDKYYKTYPINKIINVHNTVVTNKNKYSYRNYVDIISIMPTTSGASYNYNVIVPDDLKLFNFETVDIDNFKPV